MLVLLLVVLVLLLLVLLLLVPPLLLTPLQVNLGARPHIGPEYGFGFALSDAMKSEKVLIVKTAWGGKTLCGDFRPPSSNKSNPKQNTTGFYYKQMLTCDGYLRIPAVNS